MRNRAAGLQVATLISQMTDRLILELLDEALQRLPAATRQSISGQFAVVAVGGSGRGELAPYSDADILFLHRGQGKRQFDELIARSCAIAGIRGIKLGHSVRTLSDTLTMARTEPQFATALVESRLLWGDERLFNTLKWKFFRHVVRHRSSRFFSDCVAAREAEREQFGATVRQLEPDVKRSPAACAIST